MRKMFPFNDVIMLIEDKDLIDLYDQYIPWQLLGYWCK